jgi:hypothetical protein
LRLQLALVGEGQLEAQRCAVAADHERLGERPVQHLPGVAAVEQRVAETIEHRVAADLLLEVRRLQHRDGRERVAHVDERLLLRLAPRREVRADVLGEHAVDDDGVGEKP